jgi:Na+/H+ antiporter NhaD/arsenite permease-like protein
MANIVLITIIVIAVVLVVLALLVWRRQKEEKPEKISGTQKKAFFVQFIIGIAIALMAGIFMFDGDVLGENTAGISTVLGIIGICLIAASNVHLLSLKRK